MLGRVIILAIRGVISTCGRGRLGLITVVGVTVSCVWLIVHWPWGGHLDGGVCGNGGGGVVATVDGSGLDDGLVEEVLTHWTQTVSRHSACSVILSGYRNTIWVASEIRDLSFDPFHRLNLIQHSQIRLYRIGVGGEESQCSDTILQGDDDDLTLDKIRNYSFFLALVTSSVGKSIGSIDKNQDREVGSGGSDLWCVNIKIQTILVRRRVITRVQLWAFRTEIGGIMECRIELIHWLRGLETEIPDGSLAVGDTGEGVGLAGV